MDHFNNKSIKYSVLQNRQKVKIAWGSHSEVSIACGSLGTAHARCSGSQCSACCKKWHDLCMARFMLLVLLLIAGNGVPCGARLLDPFAC